MKFLMANHKDNTKFSVKQVDNRYILEKTINNICYRGSEVNMPIKLYTGTFEDGKINTQKLEEIKIINVEVYDDKNQMNIDSVLQMVKQSKKFVRIWKQRGRPFWKNWRIMMHVL